MNLLGVQLLMTALCHCDLLPACIFCDSLDKGYIKDGSLIVTRLSTLCSHATVSEQEEGRSSSVCLYMSVFGRQKCFASFYPVDLVICSLPWSVWSFFWLRSNFSLTIPPVRAGGLQRRLPCAQWQPRGARGRALWRTREQVTDRNWIVASAQGDLRVDRLN